MLHVMALSRLRVEASDFTYLMYLGSWSDQLYAAYDSELEFRVIIYRWDTYQLGVRRSAETLKVLTSALRYVKALMFLLFLQVRLTRILIFVVPNSTPVSICQDNAPIQSETVSLLKRKSNMPAL